MRFQSVSLGGMQRNQGAIAMYLKLRTASERVAALLLLWACAPLLALLALLVRRTSPGPALYRQLRLGHNGKPFMICKLRTMEHNCEAGTRPVWSAKDDPRVTRIRRLLPGNHLDELPQLWNLGRGRMRLIGRR